MTALTPSDPAGAPALPDSAPCVVALDATRAWGEAVAAELGISLLPHEERGFDDGEHKARPLASVRGRDVFVLQSLHGDAAAGVDARLARLLFFIAALKDDAARSVTAVVPYLAYARKDRRTKPRDPVTTRYVAQLFEAMGTDRVVTIDVHNLAAFQNAFRCATEHLEATGLFARHFARIAGDRPVAVVSPDAGGVKRAERFRLRLERELGRPVAAAFAEKHRSEDVLRGELLVGDVEGRCAIVYDDLISTGSTMARTAAACRARGATEVHAAATHGLFTGAAATVLAGPELDGIAVTDTVPPFRLPAGPVRDKLAVLGTAPLFAEAIRRLQGHGSFTELLEE
jgi:ribose-phosphate pyrophosphokinase